MADHHGRGLPAVMGVSALRPAPVHCSQTAALTLRFQPGDAIYTEGQRATTVYILLTGRVRLTRRAEQGSPLVTGLLRPGSLFGLDSLWQPSHGETALAETVCSVRAVDTRTVDRLLVRQPGFAAGLLEAMVRRRVAAEQLLARALLTGVAGRLAGALLDAAEGRLVVGLTRRQLASAAWTTRETATRILFQLAAEGLLRVCGRSIELLDETALRRLATGSRQLPAA